MYRGVLVINFLTVRSNDQNLYIIRDRKTIHIVQ